MIWVADLTKLGLSDSSNLYVCLTNPGSLSNYIRQRYNEFNIKLIKQELQPQNFIREVYLRGDNINLVHATVTIPYDTYMAFKSEFDSLGEKSLGETILFKRSDVTRSTFEFNKNAEHWARRSSFSINDKQLEIIEYFLPDFISRML